MDHHLLLLYLWWLIIMNLYKSINDQSFPATIIVNEGSMRAQGTMIYDQLASLNITKHYLWWLTIMVHGDETTWFEEPWFV